MSTLTRPAPAEFDPSLDTPIAAWDGFAPGPWQHEINLRDFIQRNYTPYEGAADFLTGPTQRTTDLWARLTELFPEERAKGEAARVYEQGKAEVEILRQKLTLWQDAGPEAERLFLLQMLPDIMREVLKTVEGVKIDKLTVVDGGSGTGGVPAVLHQIAGATPALLESLKASTGIDVAALLQGRAMPPSAERGLADTPVVVVKRPDASSSS